MPSFALNSASDLALDASLKVAATLVPDRKTTSPLSHSAGFFANVDHRLSLTLDRREILTLNSSDPRYPSVAKVDRQLPPEQEVPIVRISATGADLQLWHLRLERDVYYRAVRIRDHPMPGDHPLSTHICHGVAY